MAGASRDAGGTRPGAAVRTGGHLALKFASDVEPFGGVANLITTERLRQAHAALSDTADLRSIGETADGVGLFDRSSFGRASRQSFGCSPGELRLAVRCGGNAPALRATPHSPAHTNLTDLLRAP